MNVTATLQHFKIALIGPIKVPKLDFFPLILPSLRVDVVMCFSAVPLHQGIILLINDSLTVFENNANPLFVDDGKSTVICFLQLDDRERCHRTV